ncbi:molybdate ABC transporter substrate-binding protein [Rhodocaloribacter sp.]
MKRPSSRRLPFAAIAFAVLFTGGCGVKADDGPAEAREVVVFAAASLRDVMEALARAYEATTGDEVFFNFAGSNVLARQIAAAPGADLFLSAGEAWMDFAADAGRLADDSRRDLLSNRLVVVTSDLQAEPVSDPCALASLPFKYVALGHPDGVPAGTYARAWMTARDCGGASLWQKIEARIAPAPDVRSALGLALAEPNVIAVVYRTDRLAFSDRLRVLYEVPPEEGPAIRYVLARIADAPHPEAARRFYAYLTEPKARAIFGQYGFVPIDGAAPPSHPTPP